MATTGVAVATALAAGASLVNLTGALAGPVAGVRVWPPGRWDWRCWFVWLCWAPAASGLVAVGLLDPGRIALPLAVRTVGACLGAVGLVVGVGAVAQLGPRGTSGLRGRLHTAGLYAVSRNPQYVGAALAAVGWVLLTGSPLAAAVAATFVPYHLALPFVEEPWLRDRHGTAYRAYARRVPRFVDGRTLQRLRDRLLSR